MRTLAIATMTLALPFMATGGSTPAAAGGWGGCDRPTAYYAPPVGAYRYAYVPARPYYYRYDYRPRVYGYYAPPAYYYSPGPSFYSAPGWGGWGRRGVVVGVGF